MKINYVSLCSGYGAECIAFKRLKRDYPYFDFECLAWSEIEPNAIKAHDAIHQEYIGCNLGDLTKVDWVGWHKSIGNPHIDLLFASTPCQSVSNAGKNAGMKKGTDTESALIWATETVTLKNGTVKTKKAISKTAVYKLAGNSIVVSVLYHIFRTMFIPDQPENKNINPKQLTLFDL